MTMIIFIRECFGELVEFSKSVFDQYLLDRLEDSSLFKLISTTIDRSYNQHT
jgi:hypothetical protein